MIRKTDKTITKHARLSHRYSVDMTIALNGTAFTCEWHPCQPKNLSKAELAAYRAARNALVAELDCKVLVLEI